MAAAAAPASDGDGRTAYTVLRGIEIPAELVDPDSAEGVVEGQTVTAFVVVGEQTADGASAARGAAFEDLKLEEATLVATPTRSWAPKKRRWDRRAVEE